MSQFNFKELEKRLHELGKDVHDFAGSIGLTSAAQDRGFKPRLDAVADPNTLTLYVDLPGMEKEDVKVSLAGNALTISGSRQISYSTNQEVLRQERSTGSFTRSFSMPGNAKPSGIKAAFRNGVLTVTVPLEAETPESDTIIIE
ncbi:MAG: Hsp20/alpha crystallin family protein [Candidatus Cyclonatronum sp.]|uniref:Hsp20/alpha crystallin family protein n=1 Tax=Cyclonatronum sp. TaxID=3024185 RepID=UPI0025BADC82|nr:Hsp20/alpha crystallin family protein [Cyclonatronum sp.]MCC5934131.1 Hsp20/alpha crystallin family protein [Balneolales bacterium]MCH8486248.1 Hsp20/alpha crystallin family protein [Cyclonatronum sp.]